MLHLATKYFNENPMELFVVFFFPVSRSRSILLHGFLSLFQMFFQKFFVFKFLWLISQNSPGVKIRSGRSIALSWTKTCANDLLHKVLEKACLPFSLFPAVSAILPLNSPFSALCSLLSSTCFLFFFLLSLLLIDFQLVCFVFRCRVWLWLWFRFTLLAFAVAVCHFLAHFPL